MGDPCASFLIKKLIKAIAKKPKDVDPRLPITKSLLIKLWEALTAPLVHDWNVVLFAAMFTVAYHGALRVSEFVRAPKSDHTIQASSVFEIEVDGRLDMMELVFKTYKHSGKPFTVRMMKKNDITCPVYWLGKYVEMRGNHDGALFQWSDGTEVTRDEVVEKVKELCEAVRVDPMSYNSHSFRIGKCTDMAMEGASVVQIQQTGCWKSFTFLRYVRPHCVYVSKGMGGERG